MCICVYIGEAKAKARVKTMARILAKGNFITNSFVPVECCKKIKMSRFLTIFQKHVSYVCLRIEKKVLTVGYCMKETRYCCRDGNPLPFFFLYTIGL